MAFAPSVPWEGITLVFSHSHYMNCSTKNCDSTNQVFKGYCSSCKRKWYYETFVKPHVMSTELTCERCNERFPTKESNPICYTCQVDEGYIVEEITPEEVNKLLNVI